MATTYDKIATTTLSSAAATITFSSIAASWTDLKLIFTGTTTVAGQYINLTFNGSSAANYSWTVLRGNGTVAGTGTAVDETKIQLGDYLVSGSSTTIPFFTTMDVFSYAGSTNKTLLSTTSNDLNGSGAVINLVGLWRSTAAITSITLTISANNFATGTSATLYGILKA